jgi:quercetin dioxygenase-like cupin family protein
MRRIAIALSVIVLLLTTPLIIGRVTFPVGAQEATPAAGPIRVMELAPGIAIELFAAVPSARAPGQTVYLARLTFQPGAEIIPHSHPGTSVIGVVSGSFGWTLVEGSAQVTRGAAAGATEATEMVTEPGTEVILAPGDAIVYEDDVVHTARGAGDEETVILVTQVLTAGEPRLMPADMAMGATPAP